MLLPNTDSFRLCFVVHVVNQLIQASTRSGRRLLSRATNKQHSNGYDTFGGTDDSPNSLVLERTYPYSRKTESSGGKHGEATSDRGVLNRIEANTTFPILAFRACRVGTKDKHYWCTGNEILLVCGLSQLRPARRLGYNVDFISLQVSG